VRERRVCTYTSDRELQPEHKDGLEGEVSGNVVQDDATGKALEEVEESEDGPVSEPLDVILRGRGLDGLEREIGGGNQADEVGNRVARALKRWKNTTRMAPPRTTKFLGTLVLCSKLFRTGYLVSLMTPKTSEKLR
jgi:hypothetical protein